ncbi:MAG: ketopantoate reductase family protein [Eubacteriales bacterium]|nr:ketopantoate reductase family protein [Eubacteriales bacterium]MDD3200208.1 ketopantoate reductase family protein [Eubacteriales bacterium]MDD4630524.1 ketopantoate reductase family protein [Eubacteriales bacterium]
MREIRTVAIMGLGNLGIIFGNHLSKKIPREDLRFIADRERIARYEKDGIFCNGERCDFQYVTPEEYTWPADLIIFTVKFQNLVEAIDAVKNQVGDHTIILSALNGITSEGMLEEAYGMDKVLYCVAQGMDGIKEGNRLTFEHMGMLCFGDREEGTVSEQVRMVESFFQKTEFPHEVETDMMKRLWGKFMLNVGVNQTAAVYLCGYGGLQQEGEARDIMIAAMREVIPISEKAGIPLTEEDLSYWLGVLDALNPEGKPSMQQDMEAGKTTEVELFSGTVIALGQKYGISAPVNEYLYNEVKAAHV